MSRADFCDEAKKNVTTDRNQQYGEPEDNFSAIADLWSAYLSNRIHGGKQIVELYPGDVALMMALFKIARETTAYESKDDSYIDAIGYLACAGEIEARLRADAADCFEKIADSVDEELKMHESGDDVPHVCATCKVKMPRENLPCNGEGDCYKCQLAVNQTGPNGSYKDCRCLEARNDIDLWNTKCPMWMPKDRKEDKE